MERRKDERMKGIKEKKERQVGKKDGQKEERTVNTKVRKEGKKGRKERKVGNKL